MKLKYFLDHPQLKRNKALGNGDTPKSGSEGSSDSSSYFSGSRDAQTTGQKMAGKKAPKGSSGGTGNMKTNLGNLLAGK